MKPSVGGLQGLIEKAAPTLAATAGAPSHAHVPPFPQILMFPTLQLAIRNP